MPHVMFYPRQKNNNIQDFQYQRYIGIFMSMRERERERERASEKGKGKERERENKGVDDYISKPFRP
jgi:CheY-like chemotaxis protein